ncbi:tyrosine-protein kinase STK-like [Haliotis rubra]|uniref:tyrosine-protein kinase STK-like n=1 Tax=Haliotis rubra TaxID=36100 RepID=UPI001EE60083|nr:tyrosine-protein kinase STK-like [Haliotis rubra]
MEPRCCFYIPFCCCEESTSQPELVSITYHPRPKAEHVILRAIYDFNGVEDGDLSFSQGDLLKKEDPGDRSEWVVCINMSNGNEGYVPTEYVQPTDMSPNDDDFSWWFHCGRGEAEALLMRYKVPNGSFLVRRSISQSHNVLSVKYLKEAGKTQSVFHYKIRQADNGEVYVSARKVFPDLSTFLAHYKEHQDGMKCLLTVPCPRMPPIRHLRNMKVNRGTIQLSDALAKDVWRGTLYGKLDVAAKEMTSGDIINTEYLIMESLRHVRLVQPLAVCTDCEPVLLIMEYMNNGSLHDFLRKTDCPHLEFNMVKSMCQQIAEGMAFLEFRSFIHGNLQSSNILMGEHHTVKITNAWQGTYDSQEWVDGDDWSLNKWMAPEVALYKRRSVKSDVWSFGVLMYEIASSGIIPYSPIGDLHKVFREIEQGYRLPKPQTHWLPEQLDPYYNIIQQCWNTSPSDRPSFVHLQKQLEHL